MFYIGSQGKTADFVNPHKLHESGKGRGMIAAMSSLIDKNNVAPHRFLNHQTGEMNWTKVYKIRNTKAAHPSSGLVSKQEYNRLLGFLEFLFISGVENPIDISNAFEESSFEEKLAQLQQMHQRH